MRQATEIRELTDPGPVLAGVWGLESYSVRALCGGSLSIWGDDPCGILIYLPDGHMSVHVSDTSRPKFAANDLFRGTEDEIRRAFEGYTTYFGTYEYRSDEKVVLHRVTESLYPNWSGVTQTRFAELTHRTLVLKTPPIIVRGLEVVMELNWQRISGIAESEPPVNQQTPL